MNAGFLVGHSTMRRLVMGDDGHRATPPTPDQIEAMVRIAPRVAGRGRARRSRRRSARRTPTATAQPVPSRAAQPDEFLALAAAVRDHAGTTLEFIAAMGEIPADRIELMTDMSLAAEPSAELEPARQPLADRRCTSSSSRRATTPPRRAPRSSRSRSPTSCASAAAGCSTSHAGLGRGHRAARRRAATRRARSRRARRLLEGAPTAGDRGLPGALQWDLVEVAECDLRRQRALRRPERSPTSPASAAPTRSTCSSTSSSPTVSRSPRSSRRWCPSLGVSDESWQVRGRGLARRAGRARRLRRRRPRRPHVPRQLPDGRARRDGAPARAVHARAGGPGDDRRPGPPVRVCATGAASPRAAHADLVVFDPDTVASQPGGRTPRPPRRRAAPLRRRRRHRAGVSWAATPSSRAGACSPAPSPVRCCDRARTPTPSPCPAAGSPEGGTGISSCLHRSATCDPTACPGQGRPTVAPSAADAVRASARSSSGRQPSPVAIDRASAIACSAAAASPAVARKRP